MFVAFAPDQEPLYTVDRLELDGEYVWFELPQNFDPNIDAARLIGGALVIVPLADYFEWQHLEALRIREYLPEPAPVATQDFSLLPMRKTSPTYQRGRKVTAEYLNDDMNVVVRKNFSDVIAPDGFLSGLRVHFEWFKNNGTVGLSKTQIVKEYTHTEAETEMRLRRERQLDYLIASAKGTPIAPVFQAVFKRFAAEISTYLGSGTGDLSAAVAAEADSTVAGLLDTVVGITPAGPLTIRMVILDQIGGGL